MQVSGWFETEDGAAMFGVEGANMREVAKKVKALHEDAGETDMEATDQDGNDVTRRLYDSIAKL